MTKADKVKIHASMYLAKSKDPNVYSKVELRPSKAETPGYDHLDFYCVGHNSSHYFYLAVDGDTYYQMSWDTFDDREHITTGDPVYLGHW